LDLKYKNTPLHIKLPGLAGTAMSRPAIPFEIFRCVIIDPGGTAVPFTLPLETAELVGGQNWVRAKRKRTTFHFRTVLGPVTESPIYTPFENILLDVFVT